MNNSMVVGNPLLNSSMMSDSLSTADGFGGAQGVIVEEVGSLIFGDIVPKKMVMLRHTLAILSDDGKLLLGEVRSRGGDDWVVTGRNLITLNDADKKYLDLALVPNAHQGPGNGVSIIFLTERTKTKERCLNAHHVKQAKLLELREEFSSYDKVNVLGKGVSHIASAVSSDQSAAAEGETPTIFAVSSNLVRKLRLEDAGTSLKPTTARAQVPADCQDGTLAICVQKVGKNNGKPSTAAGAGIGGSLSSFRVNVIVAFRSKSSAGRSRYSVEYYNSKSKGDEIFNSKASIKLPEESEPTVLLTDPKDSRNAYVLCVNKNDGTTALHKIAKGRRNDEPVRTFNYEIRAASMTLSEDNTVVLVAYDAIADVGRIYAVQKSEGFRGRHPLCPQCPSLSNVLSSQSHIVSCEANRWRLTDSQVEHVVGLHRPIVQLCLATLVESGTTGKFVTEPESGLPYRLRIAGCDTQGVHPEAMLVEDLERNFDGEESRLQNAVLKICLGHSPCRECHSKLSGLLMGGRLPAIEMHYVKPPMYNDEQTLEASGSERFIMKPMTADKFRSLVGDLDWTQLASTASSVGSGGGGRQATFTLDDQEAKNHRPQSALTRGASLRTSGGSGNNSRIPTPRTSVERTSSAAGRSPSSVNHTADDGGGNETSLALSCDTESEKIQKLCDVIKRLSNTLSAVLDADAAVRNNLHKLRENVEEAVTQTNELHSYP